MSQRHQSRNYRGIDNPQAGRHYDSYGQHQQRQYGGNAQFGGYEGGYSGSQQGGWSGREDRAPYRGDYRDDGHQNYGGDFARGYGQPSGSSQHSSERGYRSYDDARSFSPPSGGRGGDDYSNRGSRDRQQRDQADYEDYGGRPSVEDSIRRSFDYQDSFRYGGGRAWDRGDEQNHSDPDYAQWRREQMRSLDEDYGQWRAERYKKFSDDFGEWRKGRAATAGAKASEGSDEARTKSSTK